LAWIRGAFEGGETPMTASTAKRNLQKGSRILEIFIRGLVIVTVII